jgi:hypothetical protein
MKPADAWDQEIDRIVGHYNEDPMRLLPLLANKSPFVSKYRTVEGKRYFLTATADVYGKWMVGYADTDGAWLERPRADDLSSLSEVLKLVNGGQSIE